MVGCAIAYYLAKRGIRVTVIERSIVGSGASSANSGAIALATKKPGIALELAMASQRLYPGLTTELGSNVDYVVEGNLIVAETEVEAAHLEALVADQQAAGVPVQPVSAARCRELNPLIEGRVLGGIHCPTDAQVDPFKVTRAYANAARNAGAEILVRTGVETIEVVGGRVRGVRTRRGAVRAQWVINAAGAHAPEIGRMVGVTHEVLPRRGQIIVLEATEGMPTIRVSGAGQLLAKHGAAAAGGANVAPSYTSKPLNGTVLLGSSNEFAGYDTRNTLPVMAEICRRARNLMPRLGGLHALRCWAGLRPYSASGPLLGGAGGPDGYATAIGHGGDGMALAPITGLYLAEYVAREGRNCSLPDFLGVLKTASPGESGGRPT